MNRIAAACALTLMLLTGLVLGQFRGLSSPIPAALPTSNPRALVTAERFYAAVNTLLETGDTSYLRALLHPDFVDHAAVGEQSKSARDLETSLVALRELFPGLTLHASRSIPGGDLVASRLVVTGNGEGLADGVAIEADLNVPGLDLLRVAEGLVVERWASSALPDPSRIETLGSIGIDRSDLNRPLQLERLVFQRSSNRTLSAHQGTIIIVESGSVEVRLSTYGPDDQSSDAAIPGSGDTLNASSVSLIPAGAPYTLKTTGQQAASVLQLKIEAEPLDDQTRLATVRRELAPGVVREFVVQISDIRSHAGPFILSMHLVTLGGGTSIANHRIAETEFVWAMDGSLQVATDSGAVGLVTEEGTVSRQSSLLSIAPGQGIAAYRGSEVSYRAAGASEATILLVTIGMTEPEDEPQHSG